MTTRPEETLLLQTLRSFVRPDCGQPPTALLSQITDWPYLFSLASQHGVTPLVYQFLHDAAPAALPDPCLLELQQGSRDRTMHSLRLTSDLLDVLLLFDLEGIPAVPFKGPALAAELYGDLALRDFSDIDILIQRQDVARAKQTLVAHGYVTDLPADPAQQAAYLRARYELHFTAQSGTVIEIHQSFLAPFFSVDFDYPETWRRLEQKRFCGTEILALAPGDLLLALCAHGTKHGWSRLIWICDIARLLALRGGEVDWPRLLKRAARMGASRMLLLGISLAHDLLDAPAPPEVLKQAEADAATLRLAASVEQLLFAQPAAADDLSHRFFLQARERMRDKFAYCARLAFTPTEEDHSAWPLPASLSSLYYPFHAVRVLSKYGLKSLKSPQ